MSAIMARSPANQARPLLIHPSRSSSDQRRFRTLLDLLTIEKMDGGDSTATQDEDEEEEGNNNISRWKNLRERLGLKAIGCCGIATWRCENSSPPEGENDVVREEQSATRQQDHDNGVGVGVGVGPTPINDGMNLGAALAAERQFRAAESSGGYGVDEGINGGGLATPSRVSLMRLLEETSDGCELERDRSKGGGEEREGSDSDTVCCVCMGRKKGAAFIPCGHTYCRVCSRELWLNRGSCPLCNRSILEVLDIF